ncbi:MAG TPA: alpha/beta hydrolase [Pirellulales bacterium]|nr:alpha/beta hydrolase [Pirellulales bacterium]
MPLDPRVQAFLQAAQAASTPIHEQTPEQARQEMLAQTHMLGPGEAVANVTDASLPGPGGDIPIRIYQPDVRTPSPCLVYFHGGGFVIGSIDTHDGMCRAMANGAGIIVISVDYRLAPEHKFPAAVDDAYAATCEIIRRAEQLGIDPQRVAVGGDSAGGNLAAVVALMARDRKGPELAMQLLLYPVTDANLETRSYLEYAEGYMLTREAMGWFWNHYLTDPAEREHVYASPLRAADLSKLPPALVITAECDPLCDEGDAYAERLKQAGVRVAYTCYPGMIHGFIRRAKVLQDGRKALEQISQALRATLAPETI